MHVAAMQLQRIYNRNDYLPVHNGSLHARVSVNTSKLWLIYQITFECITVYILQLYV